MTTAVCNPVLLRPVAKFDMLWDALNNLERFSIPSDLTEIDANWCYCRLSGLEDDDINDLLQLVTWETMNGFAYDLRDVWHEARIEARELDREISDHQAYL